MNLDIRLSEEGDLMLGQQQTDENGYLLYYADFSNAGEPPMLTTDPTIGTTAVRDIDMIYGEASELQLIKSRLNTENPDWYFYPQVGADLTDLIGERNSPQTAQRGKELILRALTYDGAFKLEDLSVEVIPVGPSELFFDVQLSRRNKMFRYGVTLDLVLGAFNVFEVKE